MTNNDLYLGFSPYRATPEVYRLKQGDRARHLYVIGKTGIGKSTFLESLALQDLAAGRGVAFIDPHGDSAERLLRSVPKHRTNEVIYFDPSDTARPLGLNPLSGVAPEHIPYAAEGVVTAFKNVWAHSWGPELENILRYSVTALLYAPGTSLVCLHRFITNEGYRKRILRYCDDPVVHDTFRYYTEANGRNWFAAVSSTQNKIGAFILSPVMRNIIGQRLSTINLRAVLDNRQIFIANLAKGTLGETTMHLLGSLLVSQFYLAAMSRGDTAEAERTPFNLIIDEFQNLSSHGFAGILSEARKNGLALHIAHQYTAQLPPELLAAVLGNVGTLAAFGVGEADAAVLARHFEPNFKASDLVDLSRGEMIVKRSVGGRTRGAVRCLTSAPESDENVERARKVKNASRTRYGRPRGKVERSLGKFLRGNKKARTK